MGLSAVAINGETYNSNVHRVGFIDHLFTAQIYSTSCAIGKDGLDVLRAESLKARVCAGSKNSARREHPYCRRTSANEMTLIVESLRKYMQRYIDIVV